LQAKEAAKRLKQFVWPETADRARICQWVWKATVPAALDFPQFTQHLHANPQLE
jgi:hypothetical protein